MREGNNKFTEFYDPGGQSSIGRLTLVLACSNLAKLPVNSFFLIEKGRLSEAESRLSRMSYDAMSGTKRASQSKAIFNAVCASLACHSTKI